MQMHLKQLQRNKSIPSLDDDEENTMMDLGIEQPRFPAAGRRRHTFDAFVRARYAKLAPKRFRRVLRVRYKRFRPGLRRSFVTRLAREESTKSLRRARMQLLN